MLRVLSLVVLLALAAPGSCGTGSEGGQAGAADRPTPEQQCENYAITWCNKFFTCYVQVGRIGESAFQQNADECIQGVEARLPCSGATAVTGDYNACISQIKGLSCSKFDVPQTQVGVVRPPDSCSKALSFE